MQTKGQNAIFYLRRNVYSNYSGAVNFCQDHGLRQLTRDFTSDVITLNFIGDVTVAPPPNHRMTSE